MSMTGHFALLSDSEIDDLLRTPTSVHAFLDRRVYEVSTPRDYLDVDKAWHALHFLLTGRRGLRVEADRGEEDPSHH